MPQSKTKISVYGAGNFGYALLKHFDQLQSTEVELTAFDRDMDLIANLKASRQHLYFHKETTLTDYIKFVDSPQILLQDCDVLVLAVASDATREVLGNIKPFLKKPIVIVNTAKALDYKTGKTLSSVVGEELEGHEYEYAVLAGGTIAKDLFMHEPLGVDVACKSERTQVLLKDVFESSNLTVYPTSDVIGVEYASSFKNLIAILAGIVNGLGFSYGSETHLISRLAQEIGDICVDNFGATNSTFGIGSQSWGNDLWMSCTGATRNREFGVLIGRGVSVKDAVSKMKEQHKTVEGVNTVRVVEIIKPLQDIYLVDLLYKLIIEESITVEVLKKHLLTSRL